MGDVEDFHADFLPRFIDAQRAFHDGDAEPNNTLWSTTDPVSLFAARGLSGIGAEDVTETVSVRCLLVFRRTQLRVGPSDLRCERGHGLHGGHRALHSIAGQPPAPTELRVTHIYRREGGQWPAVHRHADLKPPHQAVT